MNSTNLSVIKFSGADSTGFLQGQFTNDITTLSTNWQFAGYCSPKGRLLALFQLWQWNDEIFGLVDSSLIDMIHKRLKMYVMRSEVEITIETDAICAAVIDTNTAALSRTVEVDDNLHVLHFGNRALLVDFSGSLTTENTDDWMQACILAGEPSINSHNSELFVPQMVNLDLLDGISFKKGCYTGQEIVARMHYLGKLKQRMFVCKLDGVTSAGEKILAGDKNAGHIVCHANSVALVVIRLEYLKNSLATSKGVNIALLTEQPYPIDTHAT